MAMGAAGGGPPPNGKYKLWGLPGLGKNNFKRKDPPHSHLHVKC